MGDLLVFGMVLQELNVPEIYLGKLLAGAFECTYIYLQECAVEFHMTLTITAEGVSSYTYHHILTTTVVQAKKTADFESYGAQRFYGIPMVPYPL